MEDMKTESEEWAVDKCFTLFSSELNSPGWSFWRRTKINFSFTKEQRNDCRENSTDRSMCRCIHNWLQREEL